MIEKLAQYNKAVFGSLSIPFAQSVAENITTIAMYAVSLLGLDLPPPVQTASNTLIGMAISAMVIVASANVPKVLSNEPPPPVRPERIHVLTDIAEKK